MLQQHAFKSVSLIVGSFGKQIHQISWTPWRFVRVEQDSFSLMENKVEFSIVEAKLVPALA